MTDLVMTKPPAPDQKVITSVPTEDTEAWLRTLTCWVSIYTITSRLKVSLLGGFLKSAKAGWLPLTAFIFDNTMKNGLHAPNVQVQTFFTEFLMRDYRANENVDIKFPHCSKCFVCSDVATSELSSNIV